jgi:hypothetical protein
MRFTIMGDTIRGTESPSWSVTACAPQGVQGRPPAKDKILAAVELPRVFSHPMRPGITDPPQFEGSDYADECTALFDRRPFARRLNRTN